MRYDGTHYEPIVPSLIARSTGRNRVVGFGQEEILAPAVVAAVSPSPWQVALVTTMLGAATGWVIEEVAKVVRGKKRRS